ncbi:nuclear transport factor 2 family protein [Flagellimonas sp.]|uniref:nuclear transport factor 2 family protein n=1 Tax=Flagellimonas sp. TaxID=2058762 RepID=UPI003F4A4FAA
MKAIIIGALIFLSLTLNAQHMKDPKDVVVNLFVSTDKRDWENVMETFGPKVLLDYSSMTGNPATELSPEDIVTAWKGILPGFESTHHQVGNFLVEVDNDKAELFCYGTATHYLSDENGNIWTVVGSYDFELVSDSDKNWKINSMKFNFKYQDGNTGLPKKAIAQLKS